MKKLNNKGFSLVELIIVIAIMAVLIAVLAPQFLRYVERSRISRDNSAIGEIATSIKAGMADEGINAGLITAGGAATYTAAAAAAGGPLQFTFATGLNGGLDDELIASVGANVALSSNAYNGGTAPVITVTVTAGTGTVTIQCANYVQPDGTVVAAQDL